MKANYNERLIDKDKLILTTLTKVEDTSLSTIYVGNQPDAYFVVFNNQASLADYVERNTHCLMGLYLVKEGKKYDKYNITLENGEVIEARTVAEVFNIMSKDDGKPVIMTTDIETGLVIIE